MEIGAITLHADFLDSRSPEELHWHCFVVGSHIQKVGQAVCKLMEFYSAIKGTVLIHGLFTGAF
jgi:hypothetical protein